MKKITRNVLCIILIVALSITIWGCGGSGGGSVSTGTVPDNGGDDGGDNDGGDGDNDGDNDGDEGNPDIPSGNASVSGKALDEQGAGLSGASVTLFILEEPEENQPEKNIKTVTTSPDGYFCIENIAPGFNYYIKIEKEGRKTLKMSFELDDSHPDFMVEMIIPQGEGEVEYQVPYYPTLEIKEVYTAGNEPPGDDKHYQNEVTLEWSNTQNSNFLSYEIFYSEGSSVTTADNHGGTYTNIYQTEDTVEYEYENWADGLQPRYFRVFEKLFVADLNASIWIGSNTVEVETLQARLSTPQGTVNQVKPQIKIQFSLPVDHQEAEDSFAFNPDIPGNAVWEGNTLILNPGDDLVMGTYYNISLSNITADNGAVFSGFSDSFKIKDCFTTIDIMTEVSEELGNFDNIAGLAVDSSGNLYVTDRGNSKVFKFDSDRNFLTSWTTRKDNGVLFSPGSICMAPNGKIYISGSGMIQEYTTEGLKLNEWELITPNSTAGLCSDSESNLYYAYFDGDEVVKYSSAGGFITRWGAYGYGQGQFDEPRFIASDSSNNIYVLDSGNLRIQKFDNDGNFISIIELQTGERILKSLVVDNSGNLIFNSMNEYIYVYGPEGNSKGRFHSRLITYMTLDNAGNLYCIGYKGSDEIRIYRPDF
ncbi:MAG: hypothetical protein ACLFQV_09385 [Vulcanimicrobiota bacterium]